MSTPTPSVTPTYTLSLTVSPTVISYQSPVTEIIQVLGLAVGLTFLLRLLLEMVRSFDEELERRLVEAERKRTEGKQTDPFMAKNGYSWDYVMVFKVYDEDDELPTDPNMKEIINKLHYGELETQMYYSIQRDEVYCKIRASYERLQREADRTDYKVLFDSEALKKYCEAGRPDQKWNGIQINDEHDECSYMTFDFIYGKYQPDDEDVVELYRKLDDGKNFNGKDRLKLIYTIISGRENEGCCNLEISKLKEGKNPNIIEFYPLHEYHELLKLEKKWLKLFQWPWEQPTDEIKDYFGEKIGLYFVWLGHYTTWLMPPMLAGVLFWIHIAVNDNPNVPSLPAFAALIALWATFFLEYWKRKQSTISMLWGTTGFEEEEQTRPAYKGDQSTSIIDGSEMIYFNPRTKMKRQILSQTTSFSIIFMVVCTIASITYGKILVTTDESLAAKFTISIGSLSVALGPIIPSIANALQIQVYGAIYRKVGLILNEYENHRTDTEYEDSLIAKTFLFQFVNSFAQLFYLAFIEKQMIGYCTGGDCLEQIRKTLGTIFVIRLSVGNVTEILIPYLKYKAGKTAVETEGADPDRTLSTPEMQKLFEEYDVILGPFDDYSEMIIQYGYSTLFVSAFPLCLMMSFINNYVEMRVDGWKLCQLSRRPEPRGAEDIGTWYSILEIMSVAAVITNTAILCFSSTILDSLEFRWRLWLFIIMEHVIFGVKALLGYIVEDTPGDVEIQLARVKFLVDKVINNVEDDEDEEDGDHVNIADVHINSEDSSR